ncbi:MAG: VOC family protein [Ilumatobacteraceae bacterium]
MALHPNGVHHLAIATRHEGADRVLHRRARRRAEGPVLDARRREHLSRLRRAEPQCYIAFQQHPDNPADAQIGVTHAGNAGGTVTAGTMQHLALNVDSLDELYAMRDRIRSRGVPVIGPMNHGMCQSMYFAGPEGLALEIATGGGIDERAWIDPEVQALCGIDDDELGRYTAPAAYERPAEAVAQPAYDPAKPNLVYPAPVWQSMLAAPDEAMWSAVTSEPPVSVS